MSDVTLKPWTSGPGEILRHGIDLLKRDNDTNRRLAMISIDNAVELMVKTYLGLPTRITGLRVSRKKLQEIGENFPSLLDALEEFAGDKLQGIDLGNIEWFHRLRNELYHQGNGLTVERNKVEVYAELANILFKNLFGQEINPNPIGEMELLGKFLENWLVLERMTDSFLLSLGDGEPKNGSISAKIARLAYYAVLDPDDVRKLHNLYNIRNRAVHGQAGWKEELDDRSIDEIQNYIAIIGLERDRREKIEQEKNEH